MRRVRHPALLAVGLALLTTLCACTEGAEEVVGAFEIEATVSEVIPTVVTVTWSVDPDDIDDAYVEFGPDDGYGSLAPVDLSAGSPYEVILLGSKPASDVHFRVVVEDDGELSVSSDHTATTGNVPSDLPEISAETMGEVDDGYIVTSTFAVAPAAVILDRDGEYVWWYEAPAEDFQVGRAHMSADRQYVVFWSVNLSQGPDGGSQADQELIRVSLDGTQVDTLSVPDGHHDFATMPDGGITYIEYDVSDSVEGDRIVEVSPDGTVTEIWSVWDDFEYTGSTGPGTTFSHLNAIDYYPDEDAFYISSLGLGCLLKLDRASGELVWTMSGQYSDFTLSDGSTDLFDRNHQFQRLDDSMLVFVNGDEQTNCSDVREYAYDGDGGEVELIWSYTPDPSVYTFSLGDVSRLDSGNTLVTFSNQGQIDEVDDAGDVVWRLSAELGGALGYATFFEDLYTVE